MVTTFIIKIFIPYFFNNFLRSNLSIAFICKKFKKDKKKYIRFVKDRPFNDRRYSVNINKIKKIGWKPKDSLKFDLDEIIRWYKNNINLFKI